MDEKRLEQIKQDHQIHKELTSVLANERTYAAWVRTGLTTLATGLGVAKFLHGVLPEKLIPIIAFVLFFCAFSFFTLATWRYTHVGRRMTTVSIAGASTKILLFLTILLGLITIAVAIGILIV
jgi:putative membrane protein